MTETGSSKFITVLVNLNLNENEEILNLENKYTMDKATEDIMQSLMPYALKDKDNTYICGISYGGSVALDTVIRYSGTFSKTGAFEPRKFQTGTIEKNKDRTKSLIYNK